MDVANVRFGWRKDWEDKRDFSARRFIVAEFPLPKTYRVNPSTFIYNQGMHPACVGYASAGVKTDEEFLQHHAGYMFDGLWLYQECKKVDGIPLLDGTYPRVALKIMQDQGMKQLTIPCRKPPWPVSFWKIKAYFRIEPDSTVDFVKQVIFQYGSILAASNWYNSWMSVKGVFPAPDTVSGGHAYRICGWNETGFIVVNSWGKVLWGDNGIATMPYDMFMQYVLPQGDVWKLIDA